jgi:hypothetical protein
MKCQDPSDDHSNAQAARGKYLYRRLVMRGGVKIPTKLAIKLVGPDCAYHLYGQHIPEKKKSKQR